MGLFFYNQKGSIISIEDLPTTEIIEPLFCCLSKTISCASGFRKAFSDVSNNPPTKVVSLDKVFRPLISILKEDS